MFEGNFQVRHEWGWNNDNTAAIFTWADRDFLSYVFLLIYHKIWSNRPGLFFGVGVSTNFLGPVDRSAGRPFYQMSRSGRSVVCIVHSTTLRAIQVQIHLLHISPLIICLL